MYVFSAGLRVAAVTDVGKIFPKLCSWHLDYVGQVCLGMNEVSDGVHQILNRS